MWNGNRQKRVTLTKAQDEFLKNLATQKGIPQATLTRILLVDAIDELMNKGKGLIKK